MSVVSGWGGTVGHSPAEAQAGTVQQKTSCKLKATNIKIMANTDAQCTQMTSGVSTNQICAYGQKTDSCQVFFWWILSHILKEKGKIICIILKSSSL